MPLSESGRKVARFEVRMSAGLLTAKVQGGRVAGKSRLIGSTHKEVPKMASRSYMTVNLRLVSPVFLAVLLSCSIFPAHAGMWMLVYAEGSRPSRVAYYAAFDDVQSRTSPEAFLAELQRNGDPIKAEAATKVSQIRVNQIHESASGPWLTMYTLEFRCGSQ